MLQTTRTDEGPRANPYTGPGITMETKLMKQFRLASPVSAGQAGVAVCNKSGQMELFTIGTDSKIWNYYPDPTSGTGHRPKSTGMSGFALAAGMDHDGTIVVFTSSVSGETVAFSYTVKRADGTFAAPKQVDLPPQRTPQGALTITGLIEIHARTIDGQLYVAVLGTCAANRTPGTPSMPYLAISNWSIDPGVFHTTPDPWPTLPLDWYSAWPANGFWTRHTQLTPPIGFSFYIHARGFPTDPTNGLVTCYQDCRVQEFIPCHSANGDSYARYGWVTSAAVDLHDMDLHRISRNRIYVTTSMDISYLPSEKNDRLLDIRSPYSAQAVSASYATCAYTWQQLIPGPGNLRWVYAVHDHNEGKDGTHLFCLSTDHQLYHLPPNPHLQEARPQLEYPPLPIKENVKWVAVARNNAGNIELFCAQGEKGKPLLLLHLTLDQFTGDWKEEIVEVPPKEPSVDNLEEFISYSTDISLTDAAGLPLANAAITIRASNRTAITVGNATYSVDAATSASATTDGVGKLTIIQQTSGLGVPDLLLHVDKLMNAGQVLVLQQYGNGRDDAKLPRNLKSIEARLKDVTEDELENAKDASGKYLLKDSFRKDKGNREKLASAFNKCMQLRSSESTTATAAPHPLISRRGSWTGLHIVSPTDALSRSSVIPHDRLPSWFLSFEGDTIDHRTLRHKEAQAMIAEMQPIGYRTASADGKPFWSSIGDFFRAVVEGVVKIGKMVVDGVTATFEFTMDSVTYVFSAIVQFVQDSFDMIEAILASAYDTVVDFFERTFEWIGFLLNWSDIVYTQKALSHVMGEMLQFLEMAAPEMQKKIDEKFGTAKTAIKTYFDKLIAETGSAVSLGSVAKDNDKHDPVMAYSLGNNVVGNAYASNCKAISEIKSLTATVHKDVTQDIDRMIGQFNTEIETKPEFMSTTTYLESFSSPDKFFSAGLKQLYKLLSDLALAVVSGTQAIVDKLFDQLKSLIVALHELLTTEVKIPLLSEIFKDKVKCPLSALNLAALIAAIPTTIMYKAIHGAAPFPDEPSVAEFKLEFTAEWLLQASGLRKQRTQAKAKKLRKATKKTAVRLQLACATMTATFGSLSSILDLTSAADTLYGTKTTETIYYRYFSLTAFAISVGIQACAAPWIYEDKIDIMVRITYYYELIGLALDTYFIVTQGTLSENAIKNGSLLGVALAGTYGVIHFVLNFAKICANVGSAASLMPTFAEMMKFLLLKNIVIDKPWGWVAPLVSAGATNIFLVSARYFKLLTLRPCR